MGSAIRRRSTPLILAIVALGGGCTSPPSVTPLLRVAEKAMLDEASRIDEDAHRDAAQIDQTRQTLASAFDADLAQVKTLDAQWVKDAAEGYAVAREALARHEAALRSERSLRADNLRTAAQAQDRAIQLLERQDSLVTQITGLDLWRLTFTRPGTATQPKETR